MNSIKKNFNVLVLENFVLDSNKIETNDFALSFTHQLEYDKTKINTNSFDALIIRSKTKIESEFLNHFKNLKVIISCTSGYDHIDLNLCKTADIKVFHTPDSNADSAAELTWSLLLAQIKNLPANIMNAHTLRWRQENLRSHTLADKTLGIIGLGRIGHRIAKYALAFQMKVLYYDPYVDHEQKAHLNNLNLTKTNFETLLKNSDFLTFHVPKTSETSEMLNFNNINLLKTHCRIVNTSRASVFNNQALLNFLNLNSDAKLSLDVHIKEPFTNTYEFLNHSQVQLTAHIGAHTYEAIQLSSQEAVKKIITFFSNQKNTDQIV